MIIENLGILWITSKWTLPATDGSRVATDSLIKNTIKAGAQVDYLCLSPSDEKCDVDEMYKTWQVNNIHIINRYIPNNKMKKIIYYLKNIILKPFVPLTFSSFTSKKITSGIDAIIEKKEYDYILLDGLHLGAAFMHRGKMTKPNGVKKIIYRAQNIEQDLWTEAASQTRNQLLKVLYRFQAKLITQYEKEIISKSDIVGTIANEDMIKIKEIRPMANIKHIPLGLNFNNPLGYNSKEVTRFLFIGRLDWPPNRAALEWLLKDVWPSIIENRKDVELTVVGSGDHLWLDRYQSISKVKIIGFVEDIKDVYSNCDFCVVPMTYGSGTRIKVLETFVMCRPLISTFMGVQGADLDNGDYIHAESTKDWINTLSKIKNNKKKYNNLKDLRNKLAKKYDEVKVGAMFYDWLKISR